jgi:hypothetical protein
MCGHHQVRLHHPPIGSQLPEQDGQQPEGWICHDPVFTTRRVPRLDVDLEDFDVIAEAIAELLSASWMQLDGDHLGAHVEELLADRAPTGADIHDELPGPNASCPNEPAGGGITEFVKPPPRGVGGHGSA